MNISRRSFFLSSAGLTLGALAAEPALAWVTGRPEKTLETDVLVIGSGLSGTVSALSARESGAKVLMIDKAKEEFRGGNSRVCMGSFLMPRDGSEASRQTFVEDVSKKSLGGGRKDLYRLLADNVLDAVQWAEGHGAKFNPWLQSAPWRLGVRLASPGQYQGMPKLLSALYSEYRRLGGEALFETKAKRILLGSKGEIAGVICQTKAGLLEIRCKALILGTGGYSANRAMLEAAHPGGANILIRGNKWITGDGIALAQEIGAGTRGMAGVESLHLPVVYNGPSGRGSPTRALPYCVGINLQGRRFVDESQGYASFGKATLQQTRQTVALVFDEALRKKEKRIGMSIALFEKAKGGLIEANGCEELARKLGVPAAALRSTLEAFNRAVKADGSALEADPPRRSLASKLDLNGKLYAFFPLTPSITMDYGGLTINTKTQVTEQDGTPIRGLYAAGETVNLYYHDYHGGGILAQCLTFGRIAGQNAAQLAKR